MRKKIFLYEPIFDKNDVENVKKSVVEGWVSTAGKNIKLFENLICKYTKSKFCVACNSGTSALHIALKILNVSNNDEVIVPSISFIATINAVKYNNAEPIFMDVDKNFNLDEEKLIKFLKNNTFQKNKYCFKKKTKKNIKALIIAHIWGGGAKIKKIVKECKKRNIKILEDAAESLGTFYTNKYLSKKHTGTIGDVGILSFNGNKIITTGSGGAILTNNIKYEKKSRYLINQAKDNDFFKHNELGYNYRLPSLNAYLGISQIKKLSAFKRKKKQIHFFYKNIFKSSNVFDVYNFPIISENNYWMNILILKNKKDKKFISFLINYLKNIIEFRRIWPPNETQKLYKYSQRFEIEESKKLYDTTVCVPSSPIITKKNVLFIYKEIEKAYKKYMENKI